MDTGKLSILLVGDYPADPTLGSPKVLYKLRDELVAAGQEVTLLLAPDLGRRPRARHLRDVSSPWLVWRAVNRLLTAGRRFDAIDASSAEALVLSTRRAKTKALGATAIIARSHGLEHLNYARMLEDVRDGLSSRPWYRRVWYPATRMRLVARAIARADRLLVLNPVDRAFAIEQKWKRAEHVSVVPHGLSPAFLSASPHSDAAAGLLFCGSWDAVKGVHYLARAFGRFCERRHDAQLTVLGPGVSPDTVVRAFPEHARSHVRVVPRCDERSVIDEYRRHLALVMCSTYEGFGMVVPEAMALGLAVIATPIGAAATMIRDGENGLLVPPRDAESLARAMERVIDDGRLRARLGAAARDAVRSLTWAESARHTTDVYREALAALRSGEAVPALS